MDLSGSTLLSSGSFAPKFWEMIKIEFSVHFGVKNSKFDKNRFAWFMIWTVKLFQDQRVLDQANYYKAV